MSTAARTRSFRPGRGTRRGGRAPDVGLRQRFRFDITPRRGGGAELRVVEQCAEAQRHRVGAYFAPAVLVASPGQGPERGVEVGAQAVGGLEVLAIGHQQVLDVFGGRVADDVGVIGLPVQSGPHRRIRTPGHLPRHPLEGMDAARLVWWSCRHVHDHPGQTGQIPHDLRRQGVDFERRIDIGRIPYQGDFLAAERFEHQLTDARSVRGGRQFPGGQGRGLRGHEGPFVTFNDPGRLTPSRIRPFPYGPARFLSRNGTLCKSHQVP
jgi:hypothetical protein